MVIAPFEHMSFSLSNIKSNFKLQAAVGSIFLLFLFQLILKPWVSSYVLLLGEVFVILSFFMLTLYLVDFFGEKKFNPLSLVMNLGILNALIFFMAMFMEQIISGLFGISPADVEDAGFFVLLMTFSVGVVVLGILCYIFLVYRELFFLKQKRNLKIYFNTMLLFFILASVASVLKGESELSFIGDALFIMSIILMVVNSIRISWIAFIVKKEKIYLLVLSVVLIILFILNAGTHSADKTFGKMIAGFSPSLNQFFEILMIYGAIYFTVIFFTTLFHLPTAEAFDRKAQEVSSLQYFSKLITQVLDFKELSETITDIATKVCNAGSSWIIWNLDEKSKVYAPKNIGYVDAENLSQIILDDKSHRHLKETKVIELSKVKNRILLSENYHNIAVTPLRTHNELSGYLISGKKSDSIFDEEDLNALDTFSDYASVAIENSRLLAESIEMERLERELDVAREIQRKILPAELPKLNEIQISAVFIPAFEVGGDYYDFFEIGSDKLGFVIADVSGKGISAAFIMAEVKGIFVSLSKVMDNPRKILIQANEILNRTLDKKSFVSAAYGVIDKREKILYLSRGGHCPVILLREGKIHNLRPSGMGLGLDYGEKFIGSMEEEKINLQNNDLIVLYTDGITEAKNSKLEEFGTINFERILLKNSEKSTDEISNQVIHEVTVFSQDHPQHDDITLVILRWK